MGLKMGCCETMLRYIIFLINFVFFLASVAIIAIGAYIQIQMKTYLEFIDNAYISSAIVLIVLGAIIMIVAFFGCCGACTENACMMYTYGTLLALILIALIGVTVTIVVYKGDVEKIVKENMEKAMKNYNNETNKGVKDTWDLLQKDVKCCGTEEYKDWFGVAGFAQNQVPDSCCKVETEGCGRTMTNIDDFYTAGCFVTFKTEILDNSSMAIGVGVGIGVLIFLGVLIGCCQAKTMKERNSYA